MKTSIQLPKVADPFPEQLIRNQIQVWWEEHTKKMAADPFGAKTLKGTLYEVLPPVDSFAVLESMLTIEQILDQKVPARLIKAGGYDSCEEMLEHLLPQLRILHKTTKTPI